MRTFRSTHMGDKDATAFGNYFCNCSRGGCFLAETHPPGPLPKIGKGETVLFVVFSRQIQAAARKHHLLGKPVIIVSLGH